MAPDDTKSPDQPAGGSANQPVVLSTQTASAPRRSHRILKVALLLVVVALGVCAGYYYGNKPVTTVVKQSQSNTTKPSATQIASVHFVKSEGYPIDDHKKVTISFGLPSSYQAVLNDGSSDNSTATFISTSDNNILGSWYIGDPNATFPEYSSASIVAIDKDWLGGSEPLVTQTIDNKAGWWQGVEDSVDCPYELFGCHIQTAADRQKFLTNFEAKTETCAKDSAKGFTTDDGVFHACYTYNDSGNDSSLPLVVYGFGTVNNQPIILTASVALPDGKHGVDLASWAQTWISAIKQTTIKT